MCALGCVERNLTRAWAYNVDLTMASKVGKILVVDDNLGIRRALEILLPLHFAEVKTIPSPATLVSSLEQFRPDVVLLDMNFGSDRLDGQDGLFWLDRIMNRSNLENPPAVVMITAFGDINLAVQSLKKGASDFIQKPWDNNDLITKLTEAIEKRNARAYEVQTQTAEPATTEPEPQSTLEDMEIQAIKRVLEQADRNLSVAADKLGISRQTLYNKMKKYGIE